MTRITNEQDEAMLEALFEAARADAPEVPVALTALVLADAEALMPRARPGGLRGWVRALGGAPALGGLVSGCLLGLWLGVAPPAGLPDVAGAVLGLDTETAALADENVAVATAGYGWDEEGG
jgi:hypothetical protein